MPDPTATSTSHGKHAAPALRFDIPEGPLLDVLAAFAEVARITIQLDARLADGRSSPGVRGGQDTAAALARLLEGSGLEAVSADGRTYVVVPHAGAAGPEPPAQAPASLTTLPAVRVRARPIGEDWQTREPPQAARHAGPELTLAQSTRTLPREFVDDLGATRLDALLPYVAGASRQNDFGGTWDNIALRGFAGHEDTGMSLLRNGMAANRGYNAPRDTANAERFEFLRGPVASLMGASEPGGTLNLVTKSPSWTELRSAELGTGSFARQRFALDLGGPWPLHGDDTGSEASAAAAWRLNAVREAAGSFRDHVRTRRELLAPALAWKPWPGALVRYDGEWLRQRAPLDRGVVAIDGRLGAVPSSRFFGEPGDGDITIANRTHQVLLDQDLGASVAQGWSLHAGLMARSGSYRGLTTYGHGYGPGLASLNSTGWLWRQRRERDFHWEDRSVQAELAGPWCPGDDEHRLLAGLEGFGFRIDQRMQRTLPSQWQADGIDVHAPSYGAASGVPQDFIDTREQQRALGAYLQDEWRFAPAWTLMAGLRSDRFAQQVSDHLGGTRREQTLHASTPRLALAWRFRPEASAYATVAASFRPNVGVDAQGRAFEPERGRARELGLKWQPDGQRLTATVAAFDIVKRNVLRADADHPDFSVAADRVGSRGIEAELFGWLDPRWRVAFSASHLERALPQFARTTGSLLLMHQQPAAGGTLALGAGISHTGERHGDGGTPRLPASTLARLLARWRPSPQWSVDLDLDNLFDRVHYLSAYNDAWVTPGPPRTWRLSLRWTR